MIEKLGNRKRIHAGGEHGQEKSIVPERRKLH